MELRNFMLNEFLKLSINELKLIDFSHDSSSMRFIVEVKKTIIDMEIMSGESLKLYAVVYQDIRYTEHWQLSQFENFAKDVANLIVPIARKKLAEYEESVHTIAYREVQAKLKEEQLFKRNLDLDARMQLLNFQMQALEVEMQMLEEEKLRKEAQRVRRWTSENIFILKWMAILIVISMAIILIIMTLAALNQDPVEDEDTTSFVEIVVYL